MVLAAGGGGGGDGGGTNRLEVRLRLCMFVVKRTFPDNRAWARARLLPRPDDADSRPLKLHDIDA